MDALTPQEQAALDVLSGYGIDFGPAYIGRARAHFSLLNQSPTSDIIVDYIIELINSDHQIKPQASSEGRAWDQEYIFWHKIITEEVERLRFNQGYEPIEVNLYPVERNAGSSYGGLRFMGHTTIGHQQFEALGIEAYDSEGSPILKLKIQLLKRPMAP